MKSYFYKNLCLYKLSLVLLLPLFISIVAVANENTGKANRNPAAIKPHACPCSLFTPADAPAPIDANQNDGQPIEFGLKFQANVDGVIQAIRFYKGNLDINNAHIGNLWTVTGTNLGTITFTGETASGWQEMAFSSPIGITAGVTYVATIFNADGFYSATNNFFNSALIVSPLTGIADGDPDGPNGVFEYTPVSAFPTNNFDESNYWVDVVFSPNFPLPVGLTDFKAGAVNSNIQLSWQTAFEQNSKGFEVQRSADATSWSPIGFVNAVGQSSSVVNYTYTDKNPLPGIYYYRLKQIDLDDKFTYSLVKSAGIKAPGELILYQNTPNPFTGTTSIRFNLAKAGKVKLSVIDVQGREIKVIVNEMRQAGTHLVPFDAKTLSNGIYYYRLATPNGNIVKKMVLH
jgi:hypothetical protein